MLFSETNPEPHDPNTVNKSTLVQDSFQNMDASLYPMPQTETKGRETLICSLDAKGIDKKSLV